MAVHDLVTPATSPAGSEAYSVPVILKTVLALVTSSWVVAAPVAIGLSCLAALSFRVGEVIAAGGVELRDLHDDTPEYGVIADGEPRADSEWMQDGDTC